ncbi:hypothetical protein TCAL_16927 [Tigriopus californicus]|uniref:DNAX-activation protein 10 n=1 Tax=Tigriopus californicus TaxID=6832 RepID=A0A553NQR3_TIGCA|nr:hypothetical protein TCAL_16927 [Tigriopus californicus]
MSGQIGTTTTTSKWMTLVFVASLLGLSMAEETEVEGQESRIGNINISGLANNNNAGIIAAVIVFAIIIDAVFVWVVFQNFGRRRSGQGRPQYVNKQFNSRSDAPEDESNVLSSLTNAYQRYTT